MSTFSRPFIAEREIPYEQASIALRKFFAHSEIFGTISSIFIKDHNAWKILEYL